MQYYLATKTDKIVSHNFTKSVEYIYGKGTVENLVEEGILTPIDAPSIEDCILYGSGSVAVVRYMEQNPGVTWSDASHAIWEMKAELYKR